MFAMYFNVVLEGEYVPITKRERERESCSAGYSCTCFTVDAFGIVILVWFIIELKLLLLTKL